MYRRQKKMIFIKPYLFLVFLPGFPLAGPLTAFDLVDWDDWGATLLLDTGVVEFFYVYIQAKDRLLIKMWIKKEWDYGIIQRRSCLALDSF